MTVDRTSDSHRNQVEMDTKIMIFPVVQKSGPYDLQKQEYPSIPNR